MPVYAYGCGACGNFEAEGRRDDDFASCPICHKPARRRPFSSVPHIKGATVATAIPDPAYRQEAVKRDFNASWGDAGRSVEMLRKNARETDSGKVIDLKGMNT